MGKTKKSSRTVLYLRVSSVGQAERGMSLETQEASCRAYALGEGLGAIADEDVFIDRGVSANKTKTTKRPGWSRMMSSLSSGDNIVAVRIDRCFRSVSDAATTLEDLRKKKIDLYFVDRGLATDGNITNGLTLSILSAVSAFESELKGQRISEVKQNMIANHMFVGGKRTRGFTQQRIGGRQYLVADWKEKQLLMLLASFKKQRDKAKQQGGRKRLNRLVDRDWSYEGIQKKMYWAELKLDATGNARFSKDGVSVVKEQGKLMSLEDYIKSTQTQLNDALADGKTQGFMLSDKAKFSKATLHRLLSDDDETNVFARLKRIKEVEKKIVMKNGEYSLLKSPAADSRSKDAVVFAQRMAKDGKTVRVLKQGNLFSRGKEVAIKRIVKKRIAASKTV